MASDVLPQNLSHQPMIHNNDPSRVNVLSSKVPTTKEMKQYVYDITHRPRTKEMFEDDDSSLPYDPNLVCHKCGMKYCIGEIQKFKRHIKEFCPIKK